jgi:hypothetical protein
MTTPKPSGGAGRSASPVRYVLFDDDDAEARVVTMREETSRHVVTRVVRRREISISGRARQDGDDERRARPPARVEGATIEAIAVDIATGGSTDLRSEGVRRARRRVCVSDDEYLENNIFRVTSSRASEDEGLVGLGPSPEERARLGCRGFGVHDGGLACDSERDSGVVHVHARTFKPRRVKALGTRPSGRRIGTL